MENKLLKNPKRNENSRDQGRCYQKVTGSYVRVINKKPIQALKTEDSGKNRRYFLVIKYYGEYSKEFGSTNSNAFIG